LAAKVYWRFHRNEGQWHEFGYAAGALLQGAHAQEMPGPMARRIDVPVHDCRRGPQARTVRRFDDGKPFIGAQLVGANNGANFIVKNFGGSAG
jgi:hypothetical protein